MMYHTTSEADFELLLQLLSKTVPFIQQLKDQQLEILQKFINEDKEEEA